jgi:hypothetical protein
MQEDLLDGKLPGDHEFEFQIKQLNARYRILKEKYAAVITSQAKIYWDLKDYKSVEQLFKESVDICESC